MVYIKDATSGNKQLGDLEIVCKSGDTVANLKTALGTPISKFQLAVLDGNDADALGIFVNGVWRYVVIA